MANLSSFFGDAQGSGADTSVITDPGKLPITHNNNPIYYKYGDSHTWHGDHENDFWYYSYNSAGQLTAGDPYTAPSGIVNRIDNNGTLVASTTFPRLGADWAQYDSATYTGEWITIMDHSNEAGNLCYVKGFGAHAQTYDLSTGDKAISKIRITVDGTAYTFQVRLRTHNDANSSTLGYQHAEWGHFGRGAAYFTSSYGGRSGNFPGASYGDSIDRNWFNYDQHDEFGVYDWQSRGTTYVLHPSWFVEGRRPSVRYENSIKVECAINKYTDTVTNGTGSAGVTQHRYTHRAYAKRIVDPTVII
jgi:hypothetical protein